MSNYNNYLDFVNRENAFSREELKAYYIGIDLIFPVLFETFPNANFNITKNKAELMLKKAENENVIKSLENLLEKILVLNELK